MKKVISAFTLGALIFGTAYADLQLKIGARVRPTIVEHTNIGAHDSYDVAQSTKNKSNKTNTTWFDRNSYGDSSDSVQFVLKSDVIDVNAKIDADDPTSKKAADSDTLKFKQLDTTLKFGNLSLMGGWYSDWDSTKTRVKQDAGNWEGSSYETWKPGNIFDNTISSFVCDLAKVNKDNQSSPLAFGAQYKLGLGESFSVFVKANANSDRDMTKWSQSNTTGDYSKNKYGHSSHWTYGGLLELGMKDMFTVDFVAKTSARYNNKNQKTKDWSRATAYGLYFKPTMSKNFDATIGGSMGIYDVYLADYSFDLRAWFKVNDKLSITTLNNYSAVNWDVNNGKRLVSYSKTHTKSYDTVAEGTIEYGGIGGTLAKKATMQAQAALWNFVSAKYVASDTLSYYFNIGAVTSMNSNTGSNKGWGRYGNAGTILSVTPGVQISASKAASVLIGANASWAGLGGDNDRAKANGNGKANQPASFGEDPDFCFAIPVVIRVSL